MKPANVVLAILTIVTSQYFGAKSALAITCTRQPAAVVKVLRLDPGPKVNRTQSLIEINAKAKGHGLVQNGKRALGTTQTKVITSLSYVFAGVRHLSGNTEEICMHVKSLTAKFGHTKLQVNIPKEFKPGSCQYKVIYRHEMAHVKVNRDAVKKYALLFQGEFAKNLKKQPVIKVRSPNAGKKDFRKRLTGVANKLTAKFNAEVKKKHAVIDAPNSLYSANGRCKLW